MSISTTSTFSTNRCDSCNGLRRDTPSHGQVTICTSVYERTISIIGNVDELAQRLGWNPAAFARRVLLVNNVQDRTAASVLADRAVEADVFDEWHQVSPHLPEALKEVRLDPKRLGRLEHYLDWAIVEPFLIDTSYLCHQDIEVTVSCKSHWVARGRELLENEPAVFAVSPRDVQWHPKRELSAGSRNGVHYSFGFSDRIYLARTSDLRSPIYDCPRILPSYRYPASHLGRCFEERVDAYLRFTGRLQAILLDCEYRHDAHTWYWPRNAPDLVRFVICRGASRLSKTLPRWLGPRFRT